VSDSAGKRPDKTVSMDKKPSTAARRATAPALPSRTKEPAPSVPIPLSIQLATMAVVADIVFTLVRGVSIRGYTGELTRWLIDSNNKATGKNKKTPYTAADIAHDLSQLRNGILIQGVVVCLALAILAVSLRRARGAGGARWALLIIIVLTSGPLAVVPIAGFPAVPQIAGVLMGVASIASIILVLVPQSTRYFRATKAATRPEGAPVRPGLGALFGGRGAAGGAGAGRGSLFGPRPAAKSAAASRGSSAPASGTSSADDDNLARPKAKAKVRAETDSIAKGAELARTRAKASKSRRTET
jgi:hypothetical protein